MEASNRVRRMVAILAVVCSISLMIGLIATSPHQLKYDEPFNLDLALKVREVGWAKALVNPDNPSAVGPLFAALHLLLAPATDLKAPAVRWLNPFCLLVVVILLCLLQTGEILETRILKASSLLSVPFLWPAVGMALTELPAMVFFTGFVATYRRVIVCGQGRKVSERLLFAAVAGVALGIAILGRQTYLVVLPGLLAMIWLQSRQWYAPVICVGLVALTSSWLFLVWGGFAPPSVSETVAGMRPEYAIISLSYVAAATVFINPQWLKPSNWTVGVGCILVGLLLAALVRDYKSPPARSLLVGLFGESLAQPVGFLIGAAICSLGMVWLWNILVKAWSERQEPWRCFLNLMLLLLVAAPAKVGHQFSSRYVVGLLPVLVLIVGIRPASEVGWAVRLLIGSVLGTGLVWTYLR